MAGLIRLLHSPAGALRAGRAIGLLLIAAGIAATLLAGVRPDLVPVAASVPTDAVGGAGVALGVATALLGAGHLWVATAAASGDRWPSAAGAVGAAVLGASLLIGSLAAVVSGALPALAALLPAVLAYAWLAAVLAAAAHRSSG